MTNQKAPTESRDLLTRWAMESHHTRRSGQSGFQAVTQLLGFTHQTHRTIDYSGLQNENNLEIISEIVFSSLRSMMLPLENRNTSIAE